MEVVVTAESPLAKALQEVINPKLIELGWSTGMQDDTLSEYIILMLANEKSQEQIASELSNDLLDLGPEDQGAIDFSRWLFEQVSTLNAKINGSSTSNGNVPTTVNAQDMHTDAQTVSGNDAEMGDAPSTSNTNIPTGPKAMRNGNVKAGSGRGGRMLGQINKTLNQPQDALHRIRGGAGTGRINSHSSREPPKGPRAQQIQRGMAMAQQRPSMGNMQMPGMQIAPMQQPGMAFNPQDQMNLMAMLAETARMMSHTMGVPMNLPQNGGFGAGRPPRGGAHFAQSAGRPQHSANRTQSAASQDTAMGEGGQAAGEGKDATMAAQEQPRDLSRIVCRFDRTCAKADCPYAHHSPEARPHDVLPEIDMDNECSYGVRCANKHCNGRHPSKAQRSAFQGQQDCLYGPHCQKGHCPFKHPRPGTKECHHGGDCPKEGCTFWHTKVECKHNPCRNPLCRYKHQPGQKMGAFGDHVWKPNGAEKKEVSTLPEEYVHPSTDPDKTKTEEPKAEVEAAATGGEGEDDTSMIA